MILIVQEWTYCAWEARWRLETGAPRAATSSNTWNIPESFGSPISMNINRHQWTSMSICCYPPAPGTPLVVFGNIGLLVPKSGLKGSLIFKAFTMRLCAIWVATLAADSFTTCSETKETAEFMPKCGIDFKATVVQLSAHWNVHFEGKD